MDQLTSPDCLQFRGLTGGKVYQNWTKAARVERAEKTERAERAEKTERAGRTGRTE
jgi:hypothetical protein